MSDVRITIPNDTSKGLSHAIDAKLDAELGQDVTFSAKQWQSIFDEIKANQAEQDKGQKTFGEKDNDIKKGSHYKVNAGEYVIKESVWNSIVNKAKEVLNGDKTSAEEPVNSDAPAKTPQTQEVKETNPDVTASETPEASQTGTVNNAASATQSAETQPEAKPDAKSELIKLLPDYDKLPENLQQDLFVKYNTMVTFAKANNQTLDETTLKTRLNNYIKGWKYHNFEQNGTDNDTYNEGVKFNSEEEMKNAYKQYGKESAEFYDQDGDGFNNDNTGGADVNEISFQRMKDYYLKKGLDNKQATLKATQMVEKYSKEIFTGEDTSDEANIYLDALNEISILDRNGDGKLSAEEYSYDRLATAQYKDNKNSVTHSESKSANYGRNRIGMTVQDLMQEEDISEDDAKEVLKNGKLYNLKYGNATEFLSGKKVNLEEIFDNK